MIGCFLIILTLFDYFMTLSFGLNLWRQAERHSWGWPLKRIWYKFCHPSCCWRMLVWFLSLHHWCHCIAVILLVHSKANCFSNLLTSECWFGYCLAVDLTKFSLNFEFANFITGGSISCVSLVLTFGGSSRGKHHTCRVSSWCEC